MLCVGVICAPSCDSECGAMLCAFCSLLMFVSAASGNVLEYGSCYAMTLYVANIISFSFSHVVDVCALSICFVLRAFVVVLSICLWYENSSIFGVVFLGSVVLFNCNASCVFYYVGSGVKRVHLVLSGLRIRLFSCAHVCFSCRYDIYM